MTTLLEFNINSSPSSTSYYQEETIDFSFDNDAQLAIGEPVGSNSAINGCPTIPSVDGSMYLMGFGFVYANLKQTMPIGLQSNEFFDLDMDFRTEQNTSGLMFFNYDIDNDLFVLVRLVDARRIEINFKCRVR